ncbi:MAG: lipid A export permease/ATP-binding protein MsbA [Rhodocyclaceae bacterium]|nr:MAG: lipid A export permease/ATP-binding protein MsbA [Rhodocyclaceae bacterium]
MAQALSNRTLYFRLLNFVRPYWRGLSLGLLATMCAAATDPLLPALLKPMLDKGFGSADQARILQIPLAIVGIFALRGVLSYCSSYLMSWVANHVIKDIRSAMFARLAALPTAYFQRVASSVAISKITNDVVGVSGAATSVFTVLIRDSLTVVGLLAWLFYLNWQLTLVTLAVGPVVALMIGGFGGRQRRMSLASQKGMADMTKTVQEAIACQKVMKVFGGEAQEVARFEKVNGMLRGYYMKQANAQAASSPLVQSAVAVALAVVVYVALRQSAAGGATVGGFVSFVTAMLMLLPPLRSLADVNTPLQRGLAAAQSIFEFLDEAPEEDAGTEQLQRAQGRVVFDHFSFRYAGAERNALEDINLTIEPGECVALVGASGGGKTTLASMLPRFFTGTAGSLTIDGHDVRNITLASLRSQIALVSQETLLFNDTVAANIAYGAMRVASTAAIEAAAVHAHALDFIKAMPEGFDTVIGEQGSRLSGGQRQRIAIARAVLKDAPILILDEATSALDSESERQVQAALDELMQHRTTVVIAHRLSTIERADRIVVLDQGRIVEVGNHRALLAQGGVYAALHRTQFGAGQAA